jgi:hypothetical protein
MNYLLIDFGASFIKCAFYNKTEDKIKDIINVISPFTVSSSITKLQLQNILQNIISSYPDINGVVICTILGGRWEGDTYHSWKVNSSNIKNYCLISGLFDGKIIHNHHKNFTDGNQYTSKLEVVGYINNTPIFTSLGDTDCVIESLPLTNTNVAINIGTGSQVIYKQDNNIKINRYIPAGRAFLVFNELFESLGLNIFDQFEKIKVEDVINGSLDIDLNVFSQSHHYNKGGIISNINEGSFNIKNILGSILKEFVTQYKEYIITDQIEQILLVGGISKKILILKELFEYYYKNTEIIILEDSIESTHKGMIKIIKKDLI